MGRKLLKIGHALNPRDPVLLQSLALLEYKHSTANLARVLFRRASELDPRHQPVWIVRNLLSSLIASFVTIDYCGFYNLKLNSVLIMFCLLSFWIHHL